MGTVNINVFAPSNPHKGQLEVLNDTTRFKVLRAGRKWRKSSLGVSLQMENAALCQRKLTYPFILPYQTQARDSIWRDHVQRFLDEAVKKGYPVKVNEVEMTVTHPNGARFKLVGAENKIALRSISNWGYVVGDEVDDWDSTTWAEIIRPNLIPNKAGALLMGTPKGKRNLWKFAQESNFKEFHFTSYDNPDIDREELEALVKEYRSYGEDYFRQEIMAEYVKPVGVVYKDWNEQTNYLPFDYDPLLPLHITFDWGVNDPTVVIWIQPTRSELRVVDYYEATDANIEHFIQVINSKPYKIADMYTGDPAGKARTLTTGTSVIDILAKKGIHVRSKDGVKIPDQIRITNSVMSRLYVSTKAERFRDVLLNYRYPPTNTNSRNQDNEYPIHDEWSHGARAFEYYCVNTQVFRTPEQLYVPRSPFSGQAVLDELEQRWQEEQEDDY
jgi:hypothetical protein